MSPREVFMRDVALLVFLTGAMAGSASAAALQSEPEVLLSRFAAGAVPDALAVHGALDALAERARPEDLVLLGHLAETELGSVGLHADTAARDLRARLRHQQRVDFVEAVPGAAHTRRWIRDNGPRLVRQDGTALGPAERRSAAYAAALLAGAPPAGGADLARWGEEGEALEDAGDPAGALAVYASAAASGDRRAIASIDEWGVDTERLLLGLATGADLGLPASAPSFPPAALIEAGTTQVTDVLLEQAAGAGEATRARALEALGGMLRDGLLPQPAAAVVRQRLEAARVDPGLTVQQVAREALVELELTEVLPR